MKKRGASELIAWVLLIGFTITLGIVVSQWLREQAKSSTEAVIKDISSDLRCDNVQLNAYFSNPCDTLEILNKGYHKILKVKVRSDFGIEEFTVNIAPGASVTQQLSTNQAVEIIPVVEVEREQLACIDKKIQVNC